jgi:hypothetical protein
VLLALLGLLSDFTVCTIGTHLMNDTYIMIRRYTKLGATIALASLALVGCKEEAPLSSPQARMADKISTFDISGHAVDGIISEGSIVIYDFSSGYKGNIIGTGVTDTDGAFFTSIRVVNEKEPQLVMACVESGSYTEEASGAEITLQDGDELCAIKLFDPTVKFSVVINPWSHYAVASALFKINSGEDPETAVDTANTGLSNVFGFDILNTVPRDLTNNAHSGHDYDDKMKMASSIGGVSQFVLNAAKGAGVNIHNMDYSSIKLHSTIFNDIVSDGVLDGLGKSNDGSTVVSLGMGTELFDRETYTKDLAVANIEFVRSDRNATDLTVSTIIEEQARIASSDSALFPPITGGQALPTLDSNGPIISFEIEESTYVSGTMNLVGTAIDFSEIKSISIEVGGVKTDLPASPDFSYSLDTTLIPDGPLELRINATDFLNNTSSSALNIFVSNATPVTNITSPILTSATSYNFSAQLTDLPQGLDSVTVNNVQASFDGNGLITANTVLEEGANEISLSITDSYGNQFDYIFSVDVDLTSPIAQGNYPGDATYNTYFKDPAQSEPVLQTYALSDGNYPLYVDQFHVSLNGTAAEEVTLKSLNWPFIQFNVADPATPTGDIKTVVNDLVVSYAYLQDGVEITTRILTSENGSFIIPLTTEFLAADWAAFEGSHTVVVTVEDAAGNASETVHTFTTYASLPALETSVDIGTTLSGTDATINFTSTDYTGMDQVVLSVDGVDYISTDVQNPSFSIDTTSLSEGAQFGIIKAYKNGSEISSERVDFSVSNGSVVINVTSAVRTNLPYYDITGTAVNSVGVDYVTVDGIDANWQFLDNSFTRSFTGIAEGIYDVVVEGATLAGDVIQENFQYIVDFTLPTNTVSFPDGATQMPMKGAGAEPTAQVFSLSAAGDKVYIDQFHRELGSEELTESNLIAKGFSFIKFIPVDPAGTVDSNVFTEKENLVVSYTYKQGSTIIKEDSLTVNTSGDGSTILPIVEEYLASNFQQFTGTHAIDITTTDEAGNSVVSNFEFRTHAASPYLSTGGNIWIGGTVNTVSLTSRDFTGFDAAKFTMQGFDYTSPELTDPSFSVNPAVLSEGSINGTLTLEKDGETGFTQSVTVNVDKTAPALSNLWAQPVTTLATSTVQANFTETGSGVATISVDGTNATVGYNSFSHEVSLVEGTNNISLVITDNVGNQSTEAMSIISDSIAPELTITPLDLVFNDSIDIRIEVSDEVTGVARVRSSNWVIDKNDPLASDIYTVSSNLGAEGPYALEITATDGVGNTTTKTVNATRDISRPTAQLETGCYNWIRFSQCEITITDPADAVSGVSHASAEYGGEEYPVTITETGGTQMLTGLDEGSNTIHVNVFDRAGNVYVMPASVYVDTAAPALAFDPVPTIAVLPITYLVTGTCADQAKDGQTGILSTLTINDRETNCSNGIWAYSHNDLQAGSNLVRGILTDVAGNSTTIDKIISVTSN